MSADLLQVAAITVLNIVTWLSVFAITTALLTPRKPRPPIHEPHSNITTTEHTP